MTQRLKEDKKSGRSGGEQEGHAEDSTGRLPQYKLRGVEGVGGEQGNRIFGTRAKEAQVDKVGRRKGNCKDHANIGGEKMCPWSGGHDRLTQNRQCRRLPEWRKRWTR